ncbi:MAG: NYN domain-containing protein [Planctomycetes bacterium]|nr:NYN domain-containing protein [Planctomycetota bacterium]
MNHHPEQPRFAVLIDADNAQASSIVTLLGEIAKYGVASVKRAYGDWTTSRLNSWKTTLNENAIQPVQQFGYTSGKNATDSALIIDAMDLLYAGRLQGFCLVSSDSDFTRLATRLRESGMTVMGFGEKKTPRAFVSACDKFVYTEILATVDDSAEATPSNSVTKKSGKELRSDTALGKLLRSAVLSSADEDGWCYIGRIGSYIANQSPDFDPRNYGYSKLSQLLAATEFFEVQSRATKSGQAQKYLRPIQSKQSAGGSTKSKKTAE